MSNKQDQLRGVIGGKGGRDAIMRGQRDQVKQVKEEFERWDMANMGVNDLRNRATSGNRFERAAALQALAERNSLDLDNAIDQQNYDRMQQEFGTTSQAFHQINNKLKTYDPASAFAYIQDDNERRQRMTEYLQSNQFDAKKLGSTSLRNEDFMRLAFQNQAISNNDLEDLRKKSIRHENNITTTLGRIAGGFNNLADTPDPDEAGITEAERNNRLNLRQQQRINRNVQMAHFAQTGRIHESIENNNNFTGQIFSRLSKDTMKRITNETAENFFDQIATNIPTGKYKEAIQNVENRAAQRTLNSSIMDTDFARAGNREAEALRQSIRNDVRLNNLR